MPLVKKFEDDFTGPSIKMKIIRPYYGKVTHSAGELLVGVEEDFNNEWWSGIYRNPIVAIKDVGLEYTGDEDGDNRLSGKIHIVEVKITDFGSTGTECMGGVALFTNRENAISMGYNKDSTQIQITKGYNGSFSTVCTTAVVPDPSTNNHIYRVAWNPRPYPVSYEWFGEKIDPNTVSFFYSDDNGASFTEVGCTYTFEFNIENLQAGVFLQNWGALPPANISFDYFRYYQAYNEQQRFKREVSVIEDNLALAPFGGNRKYKSPLGETIGLVVPGHRKSQNNKRDADPIKMTDRGVLINHGPVRGYKTLGYNIRGAARLPGPLFEPSESSAKEETCFFFDNDNIFIKTVNASVNRYIQMPAGAFVPGRKTTTDPSKTKNVEPLALEDNGFVDIVSLDYMRGKVDSHGNDFLDGNNVTGIFFYDGSTDIWHSLLGSTGYYGARRDGVFVYDGYVCGPGGFGTLADGFDNTAWGLDEPVGTGGDSEFDFSLIDDDKMRLSTNTTWSGGKSKYMKSSGRWYMVADFDIEISWENFSGLASSGGFYFMIRVDNNNAIYIQRRTNNTIKSSVQINGSWGSDVVLGSSATFGKFRIKRTVNLIEVYYDIGGGWVLLRNYTHDVFAGDVFALLGSWLDTPTTNFNADIFGFTINSGITTNLAGWAREGFSINRGLNAEFPIHAIIACTETSVEIIDTDANLLWMRFIADGTSDADCHALPLFGDGVKPRQAFMTNGLLIISCSTESYQSDEGLVIFVDFSLDEIRIFRLESSSITGALFGTWNGSWFTKNGQIGIESTNGQIAARNLDAGYSGDNDSWAIQDNVSRYSCIFEDGGYVYRAIASKSGVTVNKWKRWYLFGDSSSGENLSGILYSHSNETGDIGWCWFNSSGDLFYMSLDGFFCVQRSTWESTLSDSGGTFSADTAISPLSGERTEIAQINAVYDINTSAFYIPSDEGVYKIAWPSATVTFHYGKLGSLADYDIFNSSYNRVIMVDRVINNLTPCLIVAVEYGSRKNTSGIIFAVDLLTNTVYSKSSIDYGKIVKGISA
jgi:hypothetical protein